MRDGAALTPAPRSRTLYAALLALLFAIATTLVVLISYMLADLYLAAKGWLISLPDGQELTHLRMRNLLLWIAVPAMAVLGFAVGWFSHSTAGSDGRTPAPR